MQTILTNLSNKVYEESRKRLNASAIKFGIDKVKSYDFEDIRNTRFYLENKCILDQPTGAGYWLWKPYIILEALKEAAEGDIIVCADCGIEIIGSLEPLVGLCREANPILLFGNGDFTNAMWTKRDCFILMGCNEESYWYAPHCDASFCLFRKSPVSRQFLEDWLNHCRDWRILTDQPNTCGEKNLPDFIEHRRDQAVLSLLAQKYRLSLYRMPTQFGNHYKMHSFRISNEFNCINQLMQTPVKSYAIIPYYNSPYFQLLDHHRKKDPSAQQAPGTTTGIGLLRRLRLLIWPGRHKRGTGIIRIGENAKL